MSTFPISIYALLSHRRFGLPIAAVQVIKKAVKGSQLTRSASITEARITYLKFHAGLIFQQPQLHLKANGLLGRLVVVMANVALQKMSKVAGTDSHQFGQV